MGVFKVPIELTNEADVILARVGHTPPGGIRRVTVDALVDTGATMLVIPEALRLQLGLDVVDRKLVGLADGSVAECDVVGPLTIRCLGRSMTGRALARPGEVQVLFGALQMEEMDLVVDPLAQRLIPNPASPDRARMLAVGVRSFGPPG